MSRKLPLLLAAALLAAQLLNLSRQSLEWDAAQYNLATVHYDLALHQPHPPGYPVWVALVKLVGLLTGSPGVAQGLASFGFTLAALWAYHRLASLWLGADPARAAACVLAASPLLLLYAAFQSSSAAELCGSAVVGWLAWRAWNRDARAAGWLFVVIALCAGLRPQMGFFLTPLAAVSIALALVRTRQWRPAALGAATSVAVVGAWLVPLLWLTGGWTRYAALVHGSYQVFADSTAPWLGGQWLSYRGMAETALVWLALAAVPAFAALIVLPGRPHLSAERVCFLALWVAPHLLFSFLVHAGRPGLLILALPPLFLAAASLSRWESPRVVWTGIAAGLLACYFPMQVFEGTRWAVLAGNAARSRPGYARECITNAEAVRKIVAAWHPDTLVVTRADPSNPNRRTVLFDYPGMPLVTDAAEVPSHGHFLWVAGSKEHVAGRLLFEGRNLGVYGVDR
jgi:hypothetical protein